MAGLTTGRTGRDSSNPCTESVTETADVFQRLFIPNSEVSQRRCRAAWRGADILVCQSGRLSSRPEAGLESPANRQAGKPAPHGLVRIAGPQFRNSAYRSFLCSLARAAFPSHMPLPKILADWVFSGRFLGEFTQLERLPRTA